MSFGRPDTPAARATSEWLRRGSDDVLGRQRRVVAASLSACAALGVVGLYQTGLLGHLPDPPLPVFDSDRVDASGEAYVGLDAPDALLGVVSYALTAVLAVMAPRDRAARRPLLPIALAAKVVIDALGAGLLTVEQLSRHRRLCAWCLATAAASVYTLPQVVPEARVALRTMRRR